MPPVRTVRQQFNNREWLMMTIEADSTTIKDRYTVQFTADIENNTAEQQRVRAELEALQHRLDQLVREHELLVRLSATIQSGEPSGQSGAVDGPAPGPDGRSGAEGGAAPAVVTVPRPRRSPGREPDGTRAATRRKKTAASVPPESGENAGNGGRVTLRTAVLEVLANSSEPLMAKEVATAVTDGYPSLKPTVAVVRDALNSHIAKGRADRESRQNAVWYTATETGEQPAAIGAEATPASEIVPADEPEQATSAPAGEEAAAS
ncbi:hypothetical protein ACIP88_33850 [Streptomyces uncialis]|uniref:hypothetical protein n=1 Tax=Streptomyces uncialis TaxID=1048205 RepID=UPI0037FDD9E2